MKRKYHIVALSVPIWFNKWGDHDHNGMMFALKENEFKIKEYIREAGNKTGTPDEDRVKHKYYHLVRPLVLRACVGDTVKIKFENQIKNRKVGMHLVADGYEVQTSDGAAVGYNNSSLVGGPANDKNTNYNSTTYEWVCNHEGVFVMHDAGNLSGMEDGTNLHGLFGALVVEPEKTKWRDPVSGLMASSAGFNNANPPEHQWFGDGLYVDVIPHELDGKNKTPWLAPPTKYPEDVTPKEHRKSFREYVIFIHDEPEFVMSHANKEPDICHDQPDLCGNPPPPEHATHPIMPISYRAEPMVARQQALWKMIRAGELKAPVVHEEQHHSSWLFGDPATPVLKAYIGDPVRIRLVHPGVKETHVFHLHVYSWHHDPNNRKSPLIDAISISPQTAHTIVPLWGAGNRQGATGDVIWHCHLYPHFHEGMWGMFRTFDRYQDGTNKYPDNTPIGKLVELPDRQRPWTYAEAGLGFPNFIPGIPGQRSPLPPWIDDPEISFKEEGLDYRKPTEQEIKRLKSLESKPGNHLNKKPIPGWMFNAFRLPENNEPLSPGKPNILTRFDKDDIVHLSVETQRFMYNDHCWHDPEGHLYRPVDEPRRLSDEWPPYVKDTRGRHELVHASCDGVPDGHSHPANTPGSANSHPEPTSDYPHRDKPLFVRANHGDVVTLELENRLPRAFCRSPFDEALPPCEKYTVPVSPHDGYHNPDPHWQADLTPPMQCGLHVHLVKFDPLVCDGAATGWNYLSGPRAPYYDEEEEKWRYLRMRYIWWVDEEFGVVFTHDHLFANFRQKRGLFGAMIAEPYKATWHSAGNPDIPMRFGDEAIIQYPDPDNHNQPTYFREFCIGLGDFVPLYNRHHLPLNEPNVAGGHSDHGVVGINYRSAPIRERTLRPHDPAGHGDDPNKADPAYSFCSKTWGDPDTPIFKSRPGDPIRIRLLQGSHEEQHSFQVHGMRWRRFRDDPESPLKNQQTIGISEAFSFHIQHGYGSGDYMYKFGTADDLWMGAWGIIRVEEGDNMPLPAGAPNHGQSSTPPFNPAKVRRFRIVAENQEITYCANPALSDPKGLVFWLDEPRNPGYTPTNPPDKGKTIITEPLILRCRRGEWVEIELWNKVPLHLKPEPQAPLVPVDILDRAISSQVSLHTDLLSYNIRESDGANIGRNPTQTVAALVDQNGIKQYSRKTYYWYADVEGPILLQDFADFRHHRHHGLIGALIVEPENAHLGPAVSKQRQAQATITVGCRKFAEIVLIIQDGLRLFHFGNLSLPMGDAPADIGQEQPDPTDQGQKAFNYRAQPIGKPYWMHLKAIDQAGERRPLPEPLLFRMRRKSYLRLHLVTAADKPRNHSFTLHGHTWREWPTTPSPSRVGSATSLCSGSVLTLNIQLSKNKGDYAFRSGVLRWMVSQGLWGILRVK